MMLNYVNMQVINTDKFLSISRKIFLSNLQKNTDIQYYLGNADVFERNIADFRNLCPMQTAHKKTTSQLLTSSLSSLHFFNPLWAH